MENNKLINNIINIILVAAIAAASFFAGTIFERTNGGDEFMAHSRQLQEINSLIDKNYYFRNDINTEKGFQNSLSAYVYALGDPFSYYLDESDSNDFTENIEGEYVGIGVEITVDSNNFITVINAFSGSEAEKAGIKTGDKLLKVDGEAVTGDMLSEVVAKIKGKKGEEVSIQIMRPDGELKEITIIRTNVVKETVATKLINGDIGYVKISGFDGHTTSEFENKFSQIDLDSVKGLIVDLRSNSGGLLTSVVEVSDIFMPEGTIVSVKYTDGQEKSYKSDDEHKVALPIAVLVNGGTASAAELMAGGLKDNNNAVLIGENTFGKGVVGNSFPIERNKTALVLTIGEYFLPSGKNIHKIGIPPDFEVELLDLDTPLSLLPEGEDSQLQKAIEVLNK